MDKTKILFSNGQVIVKKITRPASFQKGLKIFRTSTKSIERFTTPISISAPPKVDERVISSDGEWCKCVSPLGFYYYKRDYKFQKNGYKTVGMRVTHRIWCDDGYYDISYLSEYNETHIGHETRPWDLYGNGMPDHFINDLEKVIKNIVDFLYNNKYDKNEIDKFKTSIFMDLFGSIDGTIKNYTDIMKLEAHGFDPVISFRKEKEK